MSKASMAVDDWVRGDLLGLEFPAHIAALRSGGEAFLTRAFRASGALAADNRVSRITQCEELRAGSTGRKLLLSVAYEKAAPGLHTELFVKFSRDFDDDVRDSAKRQMESEVRFAVMSRAAQLPIAVPACLFADYQAESGSAILIAQRIAFGTGNIERHYDKCLDYELPEPLRHYKALIAAIARLAAAHKAGRLGAAAEQFPFDANKFSVGARAPDTPNQVRIKVAKFSDFACRFPRLLPLRIRDAEFTAQLGDEAARLAEHQPAILQFLQSDSRFIALCHWNANIDNAWFWRNAGGDLECGLMDWGHVGQMNVVMGLWGALSGAEIELWDDHFDELLALFVTEFQSCGGPPVDVDALKLHLHLYIAMMGVTWLLDVPALVQARVRDLATVEDRFDPRIKFDEAVRVRLQMMSTFLCLWKSQQFALSLARFLEKH